MTKNMGMAYTIGQMGEGMRETGTKGSSMGRESTFFRMDPSELVYGRMVVVKNGSIRILSELNLHL